MEFWNGWIDTLSLDNNYILIKRYREEVWNIIIIIICFIIKFGILLFYIFKIKFGILLCALYIYVYSQ